MIRLRALLPAMLAALLLPAACAAPPANPAPTAPAASASAHYPLTVTVAGRDVQIAAAPQRIVALSSETADIALALVGAGPIAAVAAGSVTAGVGNMTTEAAKVPTVLPAGVNPDPEQILALAPDLVLMTARHTGEETTSGVLTTAGIPVLAFADADFATPEAVKATIITLGTALDAHREAHTLATTITTQVERVTAALSGNHATPRVLAILSRGGKIMIGSSSSLMCSLIEVAGGTCIAAQNHLHAATPLDAEMLVATAPDIIIAEDFYGAGLGPFQNLLRAPAVQHVPAVANNAVHAVSMSLISATATFRIGEGLTQIASLLHPDLSFG